MSLSKLPDELLLMICEKLAKVRDLVAFSCCSKRLNFICKEVNYINNVYVIDKNDNCKENSINSVLEFNKNLRIHLDLSSCKILDVSMYGNTYILKLSNCYYISDVSKLSKVHTLDLSYCDSLEDVSMLGNVHNLNLSSCSRISDVSNLGNVHTLDLSYCKNITDVSMLGNVRNLNLSDCRNVKDFSMLGNVSKLILK